MSDAAMLSCREAVERLWAFIDDELPESDAAAVRKHLEACSRCYPHFDFQKAFCDLLRTCRQEDAPADLRRRIFAELLAEERRGGEPAS